jgi:hypothetical protein
MQRVETDEPAELRAITVAEHRDWPTQLDWEEGPDALRYPFLYEPVDLDDAEDEDDLEPLDIQEHDLALLADIEAALPVAKGGPERRGLLRLSGPCRAPSGRRPRSSFRG